MGFFIVPGAMRGRREPCGGRTRGERAENGEGHVGFASVDPGRALPASVEGHPVRITLDTGADQSIVSQEAVKRLESVSILSDGQWRHLGDCSRSRTRWCRWRNK
jgi:hypothetical protein